MLLASLALTSQTSERATSLGWEEGVAWEQPTLSKMLKEAKTLGGRQVMWVGN